MMMMMMVSQTSARIVSSSAGEKQEPITRKLATCEANCGTCTDGNVQVTFLDFLDLTIVDMFWQGIVICLPLNLAQFADDINLGTCCKDSRGVEEGLN